MHRILKPSLVLLMMSTMPLFGAEPNGKLKVFILAGQSNMEGHAKVTTFGYLGKDPATAPMLKEMQDADGQPRVCDNVWIAYLTGGRNGNGEGFGRLTAGYGSRPNPAEDGGKIGPEFTFGLTMNKALADPILIIKTAWGGKSLHTDFRPPSAGPYELTPNDIAKKKYETAEQKQALKDKTGQYYRDMIEYVNRVLKDITRVYPEYDADKGTLDIADSIEIDRRTLSVPPQRICNRLIVDTKPSSETHLHAVQYDAASPGDYRPFVAWLKIQDSESDVTQAFAFFSTGIEAVVTGKCLHVR